MVCLRSESLPHLWAAGGSCTKAVVCWGCSGYHTGARQEIQETAEHARRSPAEGAAFFDQLCNLEQTFCSFKIDKT